MRDIMREMEERVEYFASSVSLSRLRELRSG